MSGGRVIGVTEARGSGGEAGGGKGSSGKAGGGGGGRGERVEVGLRAVEDADLDVFFEHQRDTEASGMAAVDARDKDQFAAHWVRVRANETAVLRTIVAGGAVAGNVVSWVQDGQRLLGYWVGREYWGRGIATAALAQFVRQLPTRPLWAHVATHNAGSIRVLEKAGFRRDREQEAAMPGPEDGIEEFVFRLDA